MLTAVEYTLDPEDVCSARLLAIGIRPRMEFSLFAVALAALLGCSVSPWNFEMLPLLIGLTASLGAFRVIQIGRVKLAALDSYRRNPTLRRPTAASWNAGGVTISPAGAAAERIPWQQLRQLRENERILLMLQGASLIHAIPKRAFPDAASLAAFRAFAREHCAKGRP